MELFSLALTVEAIQGKTCHDSLLSAGGGLVWAKISGGRGRPWGIFFLFFFSFFLFFFVFYRTRHILLPENAKCTVLRAVVLTQYRRVTDGQTDRRNCYS